MRGNRINDTLRRAAADFSTRRASAAVGAWPNQYSSTQYIAFFRYL